jgi:hypothetical protein
MKALLIVLFSLILFSSCDFGLDHQIEYKVISTSTNMYITYIIDRYSGTDIISNPVYPWAYSFTARTNGYAYLKTSASNGTTTAEIWQDGILIDSKTSSGEISMLQKVY